VAPPLLLLAAVAAVAAVTLVTGLLSSRGVCDHPPLEVLRQET
jgi:putative ABC transport system permease protein